MNAFNKEEDCLCTSEKLLSIEVTSHCNIQCLHCFVKHKINQKLSLPLNVVKNIIKEGYDLGYRRLHFTGGEPLLRKDIFKALNYAFYLGYKSVLINTNGILLSKENCDKITNYSGVMVTVSLDGPEKLHDRIRGKGSYKLTMQGIENAANASIDPIVFTTIYKSLLPELLDYTTDLFREFPAIQYVSLIPLQKSSNNGFALSEELLEPDDFVHLVRTVPFLNLAGLKIDILNSPLSGAVSNLIEIPFIRWSSPIESERSLIIMADGMIRPSHFSRTLLGQYKPGMLQKILDSNEYNKLFSPDETTCSDCQHSETCRENGMFHPLENRTEARNSVPYCMCVLDMVTQEAYQGLIKVNQFSK